MRLPSERFLLNGVNWGLKDMWAPGEDTDEDDDEDDDDDGGGLGAGGSGDAMEGVETTREEDVGGDGVEGGTMEDVFGNNEMADEEMAEE